MKVLLIDELATNDSDLLALLRDRSEALFASTIDSALYSLRALLDSGAHVPDFNLVILQLSEPDFSGRQYERAVKRLSDFFKLLGRELPTLILVCAGKVSIDVMRLAEEIGDTLVVSPQQSPKKVVAIERAELVEKLLAPEFFLVHD